jgi:hypothetical protein
LVGLGAAGVKGAINREVGVEGALVEFALEAQFIRLA